MNIENYYKAVRRFIDQLGVKVENHGEHPLGIEQADPGAIFGQLLSQQLSQQASLRRPNRGLFDRTAGLDKERGAAKQRGLFNRFENLE
jgi:hypothetical protein